MTYNSSDCSQHVHRNEYQDRLHHEDCSKKKCYYPPLKPLSRSRHHAYFTDNYSCKSYVGPESNRYSIHKDKDLVHYDVLHGHNHLHRRDHCNHFKHRRGIDCNNHSSCKCGCQEHRHADRYYNHHSSCMHVNHHNCHHHSHPHSCNCKHHPHGHSCNHALHHTCDCNLSHFKCRNYLCDDRFRLHLGGLQGGLNFRLRQLIGCQVKMELEEGKEIEAKICFVGSDFVEVVGEKHDSEKGKGKPRYSVGKKKKKSDEDIHHVKTTIIPFESINWIELAEYCDCGKHH